MGILLDLLRRPRPDVVTDRYGIMGHGPVAPPTPSGPPIRVRDPHRRFTREELDWMKHRAGGQCECPDCHHAGAHGGRCLALFDSAGVQAQGDHLVSWDEGGATDPVLNGAALCAPCNGAKSNVEFTIRELGMIAANRRVTRH